MAIKSFRAWSINSVFIFKAPVMPLLANFNVLQKLRCGLAMMARLEGNIYLNILIEFAEDHNHPIEREAAKLCVANMDDFRRDNV